MIIVLAEVQRYFEFVSVVIGPQGYSMMCTYVKYQF